MGLPQQAASSISEAPHLPSHHCSSPRGCRCLAIPITRAKWRRLEAGDPRELDRTFGWVPEGGPKTLEEAMGRPVLDGDTNAR